MQKQGGFVRSQRLVLVSGVTVTLAIGYLLVSNSINRIRAKQLEPIMRQIRTAHKPRVMAMYVNLNNCSVCEGYTDVIENATAKYIRRVDFQLIDVQDSANDYVVNAFGIHDFMASPLPRTLVFNSAGHQVADISGLVSLEELDRQVRKALES